MTDEAISKIFGPTRSAKAPVQGSSRKLSREPTVPEYPSKLAARVSPSRHQLVIFAGSTSTGHGTSWNDRPAISAAQLCCIKNGCTADVNPPANEPINIHTNIINGANCVNSRKSVAVQRHDWADRSSTRLVMTQTGGGATSSILDHVNGTALAPGFVAVNAHPHTQQAR